MNTEDAQTATSGNTQESDQPLTYSEYQDGTRGTDSASPYIARVAADPEKLHSALAALTEKQRFVVMNLWGLIDGTEYSFRDLASVMGVNVKSVYQLYERGMRQLGRRVLGANS